MYTTRYFEMYIDLSHEFTNGMPVPDWPGEHRQEFELVEYHVSVNTGQQNNMHMNIHCGTHLDAPYHYCKTAPSVDKLPLESLAGVCNVVEIKKEGLGAITEDEIRKATTDVKKGEMLFVRTGWEDHWGTKEYETSYPYFTPEAGKVITELGVSLLGIDTPGPDAPIRSGHRKGDPLHLEILCKNIPVLENLTNLKSVAGKKVFVYSFPIKITGSSGAPVRVVATEIR